MVKIKFRKSIAILLFLLCVVLFFWIFVQSKPKEAFPDYNGNGIYVHFIDVGQGDCSVIQTPGGNILVDAGTPESGSKILDYLHTHGIETFAYAVFTHPHSDHIGSAAAVLRACRTDCVIIPETISISCFYDDLLNAIEIGNCKLLCGKAGLSVAVGETHLDFLSPIQSHPANMNDDSLVFRLSYNDASFLFTGDAEFASENEMLANFSDALTADVLKVAHHGSKSSSGLDFIRAVSPQIAVISVGKDNDFGHPNAHVLMRLQTENAEIFRTDRSGDILICTDGKAYTVFSARSN